MTISKAKISYELGCLCLLFELHETQVQCDNISKDLLGKDPKTLIIRELKKCFPHISMQLSFHFLPSSFRVFPLVVAPIG